MENKNKIDLVYILGTGSHWQNNEIRYSLRSVEKNVSGIRKIFIIGERPSFINDEVIHIPYKDVYTNKARNIMAKILRACNDTRITKNFMLWNDDYFAMQPFSAIDYPYYFKCDLHHSVRINKGEYKLHCEETLKVLIANGLNVKNFDCHYPIIYDKFKAKKMIEKFDWNTKHGYVFRSMYCNYWNIEGEFRLDCKTNTSLPGPHIPKIVEGEGKHFLSIGDGALNMAMRSYLMNRFSWKSKFEY